MKKLLSLILVLSVITIANSQTLKPYILGSTCSKSMNEVKTMVQTGLEDAGFTVVGQYMPVEDATRWVMVVSHPALDKAVKSIGELTGFASTLRLALTKEGDVINVSYTNPAYWGNAYFRKDFDKVAADYKTIEAAFKKAVSNIGTIKGTQFGSKKGLTAKDLRKYHYMFGMPYFSDTKELQDFGSHSKAVTQIDKSLNSGTPGVKKVYKYNVPGTNLTLYGLALTGETGESNFMPKIDLDTPKHTAFLPYELLVMDNEVHMLHGRFRIAIAFPDLTMGTFTKIMSSPGDIEDLLIQLVEE